MFLNPYLNFDGDCAEAFRFYEKALGGKILRLDTFEGSPMAGQMPAEERRRIIHARLQVGDNLLMGSDSMPGRHSAPAGFGIALGFDDRASADRAFDALAEGGRVDMPLQKTFFAEEGFGMVVDKYGFTWLVSAGAI
ncbi:MAG TPA: VOC family protein [Caulobacteraceae bacterium]|nr:VOC family protein [Caulobacteraceae bacterium]